MTIKEKSEKTLHCRLLRGRKIESKLLSYNTFKMFIYHH